MNASSSATGSPSPSSGVARFASSNRSIGGTMPAGATVSTSRANSTGGSPSPRSTCRIASSARST